MTRKYQYDNAGNLLEDGRAVYGYDAFNRCTKVETFDGNVQINRYDAEGLRHEMEENGELVSFIFRDREVVAEESQAGRIRYIRTGELLASDAEYARTYYHYASDEMGSITHVVAGLGKEAAVDGQGNGSAESEEIPEGSILNRYEYDAWGNLTVCEETVPNRFRFNGQQYDPVSQQYYLRARYYNPVIGRFTQEDTYRGDGLNLYAYCRNNPVCYVDPSGHMTCEEARKTMQDAIYAKQDIKGLEPAVASELKAWFEDKRDHNRLTPDETDLARRMGLLVDENRVRRESGSKVHTGDTTPRGREYTSHAAERANERGFDSQTIDSIIDNNRNNRVKEIDNLTGEVTWRYQDKRGNTVITNEWGDKIVTVYSHPKHVNGGKYIPKN